MAESVVILEPGDEKAQKIAKAMASQTAGDILRLIGTGEKTSTQIAEQLALPMNTVQYHTENLLEAGLISVASTKYSVKGREVKVYTLTSQLLIVAPKQANVRSLLLKYASLFGIVTFGSLIVAILSPLFRPFSTGSGMGIESGVGGLGMQETDTAFAKSVAEGIVQNATTAPELTSTGVNDSANRVLEISLTPVPVDTSSFPPVPSDATLSAFPLNMDPVVAFFLGGMFVILVLACYEIYHLHSMNKSRKEN